jgi:hypothetical protein
MDFCFEGSGHGFYRQTGRQATEKEIPQKIFTFFQWDFQFCGRVFYVGCACKV